MKRCPKCNRSFPDDNQKFCTIDGGLLVIADQPFDPNATIHSPAQPSASDSANKAAAAPQHDWNETIALSQSPDAPTAVLPRQTGPTGSPTVTNLRQSPQAAPPPPTPKTQNAPAANAPSVPLPQVQAAPQTRVSPTLPTAAAVPKKKKSKLPLILGVLALFLVIGVTALAAGVYFFVIKPRREAARTEPAVVVTKKESENSNANTNPEPPKAEPEKTTPAFVAPPNTTKFVNSNATLDGKLAEHYLDFSFYYPNNWIPDPKAGVAGANNFAKVERKLPDIMQESFAVGWYSSKGSFAADEATFPQLVEQLGATLAKSFPGYRKVSEGPTRVNSLDGYEFRFVSSSADSENGDLQLWGRVIFLPSGTAGANGATLVMLATSRAPELSGVEDLGVKGELPLILDSFRFGKSD
ncbi:MAG: hypothetical protein QOJ88_619 [Pyrinomonadaceae bacterium]|jgi:hypothetical protein|nr:hypothetical protein [Pyrinomonadaceae bacterium]